MSTEIQATATPTPPRTTHSGIQPYRLTVRQFEKMIQAGIFRDEDHVELLGGILVDKMTKHDPHNFTVGALGTDVRAAVVPEWIVREEKSIVLGRFSRPEPDVAVARGPRERYRSRSPRPVDLGMLIEVADSSYAKDRGKKWRRHAAAGIPVYWIANLPQSQIEVYSAPSGKGRSAAYRDVEVYGRDDQVPVILEGKELGRIPVRDVLS
jgi:Uma2 family endonuclease